MSHSLRSLDHPILGSPSQFHNNVLPTLSDVLKRCALSRKDFLLQNGKDLDAKVPVEDFLGPVTDELLERWTLASIPTQGRDYVFKKLAKAWEDAQKKNTIENKDKLFDICSCQCPRLSCSDVQCNTSDCSDVHIVHKNTFKTKCSEKCPKNELEFLFDQRGPRKMGIGMEDSVETKKLQMALKRETDQKNKEEKETKRLEDLNASNLAANQSFFLGNTDEEEVQAQKKQKIDDLDYVPEIPVFPNQPKTRKNNMCSLERTAKACDHIGIDSRKAAYLINCYAMDKGYLTEENKATETVDKNKIDRWRKKEREKNKEKEEQAISASDVEAVYFDGKKCATLTRIEGSDGKTYQRTTIQDQYVLLQEPDDVFLGHTTPHSGHGISVGVAVYRSLKEKGWHKKVKGTGADGTVGVTGGDNGAIAYMDKLFDVPLLRIICLLHGLELPFRALFKHYDGNTSGPHSFKGPIGRELSEDLTKKPIVKFARVKNDSFPKLSDEVLCDLSHDQSYFYDMNLAIIDGHVSENLALKTPGALDHARFLGLATLILRDYVSTQKPSRAMKRLVFIIVHFYAPSWFWVKSHPYIKDGPRNLHKMIEYSRKLTKKEQEIVQTTIQKIA